MNLKGYKGCNPSCWDYALLCIGGICMCMFLFVTRDLVISLSNMTANKKADVGSGVYTGRQTHQIRKKYGIEGTYSDDIIKGIFCQPCSLIRNELEVRRREGEKRHNKLSKELQPPVPLQDTIVAMAGPYKSEPRMTSGKPKEKEPKEKEPKEKAPVRQVHFRKPAERKSDEKDQAKQRAPRIIPLCPTEKMTLPLTIRYASPELPSEGVGLRSQALTPISEKDSIEDYACLKRENNPNFPQVQDWLQAMVESDVPTAEKATQLPGPDRPPSLLAQTGSPGPEAYLELPQSEKKDLEHRETHSASPRRQKDSKKSKKPGKQKRAPETLANVSPQIFLPLDEGQLQQEDKESSPESFKTPPSRDITSPVVKESARASPHAPDTDVLVSMPSNSQRAHGVDSDDQVPSREFTPEPHDLSADKQVALARQADHKQSIRKDPQVDVPHETDRVHSIGKDDLVDVSQRPDRSHTVGKDDLVALNVPSPRPHDLDSDELVSLEEETKSEPEPGPGSGLGPGHELLTDPIVPVSFSPSRGHELDTDARSPTPQRAQAREHSLSKDKRVAMPLFRVPSSHGIHPDARLSTPELVRLNSEVTRLSPEVARLNLEHDILQDRQVLTPKSPKVEEHGGLQADKRVASPASRQGQHALRGDEQAAAEPSKHTKALSIQGDQVVSPQRTKDHSIGGDNKVAQRAYQLLEHFLEQDRKSVNKAGSRG